MTNAIIDKLIKFRTDLFSLFKYRSDSTMDLVDAIAGQSSKESAVKISLSNLFRRTYSSITDVVDNLFRREADVNLTHDEMQEAHFKMTELLIEQGSDESAPFLFDAVRVTVLRQDGTALYKKPLWLMVTGARRQELSLAEIADSYFRRFDIEHFFRFGKQKLLLDRFQTPDARHEENWWWICIFSYIMLYHTRLLANQVKHPWERRPKKLESIKILTPSQVQRDYERIIKGIGTPASAPKPRGNSSGRREGTRVACRKDCPIVKKAELSPKNKGLAAA
jgi:hypothetical protein